MKLYLLLAALVAKLVLSQNLLDYIDVPTSTESLGPESTNILVDDSGIRVYSTATAKMYYASAAPLNPTDTKTVTVTTSELPIRIMYGSAELSVSKSLSIVLGSVFVSALFFTFA